MRPLSDSELTELKMRLRELEHENAHLRCAVARAYCGQMLGAESCQLPRNHEGLHAWMNPSGEVLIRW